VQQSVLVSKKFHPIHPLIVYAKASFNYELLRIKERADVANICSKIEKIYENICFLCEWQMFS